MLWQENPSQETMVRLILPGVDTKSEPSPGAPIRHWGMESRGREATMTGPKSRVSVMEKGTSKPKEGVNDYPVPGQIGHP